MNINPFPIEIKDGLGEKVKNNSITFASQLIKSDMSTVDTEKVLKSVAGMLDGKNFDLYYIQSILASVGANKNDDWFLPEEIWAARNTPIHKQLNYMHSETEIIGAITDSILLDVQGNLIADENNINQIKDIATQAVIWTHWGDEALKNKVSKIIASIEKRELFVSMEALFKKFDYMLVKGDVVKLIPRNQDTAFLTKYLRAFGGSGEYDGNKIYRVLRDFTFSGKGIVSDPANPRSIIDDSLFDHNCSCADCGCEEEVELDDFEDNDEDDFSAIGSEQNKKVKLNKPFRTPNGPKKFSVYVKNDKGNVVKVNFGDPNMEIKRDDPERRKSFRARHNCDNPGPKWKAKYWSCKFWSSQDVNKLTSSKAETIMENTFEKEVAELKAQLVEANKTIASMKTAEAEKVTAQVSQLQSQITELTKVAAESKAAMDKMEKDCAAKVDEMDKANCEKMKECEAKLAEATAQLVKLAEEKAVAERVSKLVAARVSEEKAQEIVKTFASLNDELFAKIVPLYEVKAETTPTEKTSVEDGLDKAKASVDANKPAETVETSDKITELSKSIASNLTFLKSKENK